MLKLLLLLLLLLQLLQLRLEVLVRKLWLLRLEWHRLQAERQLLLGLR